MVVGRRPSVVDRCGRRMFVGRKKEWHEVRARSKERQERTCVSLTISNLLYPIKGPGKLLILYGILRERNEKGERDFLNLNFNTSDMNFR